MLYLCHDNKHINMKPMKQKKEFKVMYLLKCVLILFFIVVGEVFTFAKNCDGIELVCCQGHRR